MQELKKEHRIREGRGVSSGVSSRKIPESPSCCAVYISGDVRIVQAGFVTGKRVGNAVHHQSSQAAVTQGVSPAAATGWRTGYLLVFVGRAGAW